MTPKISIITVCYNEPKVARTCESIVNQTYKDYEWIVIDGGSTGKCIETLKSYADKMTVFVSEKDSGIYNAMNKGIKQAKGEYLIFMNAGDNFFHSEVLALVHPLLKDENEIVYCDNQAISRNKKASIVTYPETISPESFIFGFINHQSTFIKRDLFARFGDYDENYPIFADIEKWLVFLENGCRFKHLPIICAEFYHTGVSSCHNQRYYAEKGKMLAAHFADKMLFEKVICHTQAERKKIMGLNLVKIRNKGLKKTISVLGLPVFVIKHQFIGKDEVKYIDGWKLFGLITLWKKSYNNIVQWQG